MQKKTKKTTFDHWIIFPFFRMIKVFEKKTYKFCTNIFHLPQICIVYFCWLLSHNFQSFSLDSSTTKYKDRLTQYKNKSKYRKNYITHCLPQFWLSATKQQQQLCGNKILAYVIDITSTLLSRQNKRNLCYGPIQVWHNFYCNF